MNKLTIIGRLTAEPVRRATQTGKELASFTLAVDDGWGENKRTLFFRCTAWEKKAAPILMYCHKGDKFCVMGRVSASAYTSNGEAKADLDVVVEDFEFCEGKRDTVQAAPPAPVIQAQDEFSTVNIETPW